MDSGAIVEIRNNNKETTHTFLGSDWLLSVSWMISNGTLEKEK